jgi:hypothetical protein
MRKAASDSSTRDRLRLSLALAAATTCSLIVSPAQAQDGPRFSTARAIDRSVPLRDLVGQTVVPVPPPAEIRREPSVPVVDTGFTGDQAVQSGTSLTFTAAALSVAANFEGLSNTDNFNVLGGRVNPPDPVGDVGPSHYVEMTNLVFAVYSKATGTRLLGPASIGSLWVGFAIPDCAENAGDPIVVYDQFVDRWILTQFTSAGPLYWNCVAISTSGDPTGSYYRYAFETGPNFPDYPKYGVWRDSYVITTREFGPTVEYGIGVYGLEKNKMVNGQPARAVRFFLDGNDPTILPLIGDGLLPADIDGKDKPKNADAIPLVGTQDDGGPYGATFDAINIWRASCSRTSCWRRPSTRSSPALPHPAIACHSLAFRIRTKSSTSCRIDSDRCGVWPTATSRTTNRWSPTRRLKLRLASRAFAGTRSAAATTDTCSISRAPMRQPTAFIDGWQALLKTARATSRSATVSWTPPPYSPAFAPPAG